MVTDDFPMTLTGLAFVGITIIVRMFEAIEGRESLSDAEQEQLHSYVRLKSELDFEVVRKKGSGPAERNRVRHVGLCLQEAAEATRRGRPLNDLLYPCKGHA